MAIILNQVSRVKQRRLKKRNKQSAIAEMLRVDHAGEYGARRIYKGQLSVLKGHEKIQEMYEQEKEHLDFFENEIKQRGTRPTLLLPLWDKLGFALGAVSARMGEKAAMACTVAVEEVIGGHYQEQIDELETFKDEKRLVKNFSKFRDDELEHKEIGLEHGAEGATAYPLLYRAIKLISRTAIAVTKKI